MPRIPITLRPAEANLEDGLAFARYLDVAAEGFFRGMLGRRSQQILATAFLQVGHDLSHENVTFAEHDGAIVGMVCGYTAAAHRRSTFEPLKQAAGRWHWRMRVVLAICAPLIQIVGAMGDRDYYLLAIAVDEPLRGAGIGSQLLDFAEETARACGSDRLVLDVSGTNEGGRRLYERRGMAIEWQWPKRWKIAVLKLYRMTKEL